MNIFDFYSRQLPDYYPSMYLDGYTPDQIYASFHRMLRKQWEAEQEQPSRVHFTYEVKHN